MLATAQRVITTSKFDSGQVAARVGEWAVALCGADCVIAAIAGGFMAKAELLVVLERTAARYRTLVDHLPGTAVMVFDEDLCLLVVAGRDRDMCRRQRAATDRTLCVGSSTWSVRRPKLATVDGRAAAGDRQWTRWRFDPMSTAWPVIVMDVVAVLAITVGSFELSLALAKGWLRLVLYLLIGGAALMLFVALPLRHFLAAQRREVEVREDELVREGRRREFSATLTKALDMAQDEGAVLGVAGRALDVLTPGAHAEILLADSSQAHLLKVVESPDPSHAIRGCTVSTPHGCPAVRMGHALMFHDSARLDVCPHLMGRGADPYGAVCVPVGVMGAMVGVVHVVHPVADGFDDLVAEGLEPVAHQLGSRLGRAQRHRAEPDPGQHRSAHRTAQSPEPGARGARARA